MTMHDYDPVSNSGSSPWKVLFQVVFTSTVIAGFLVAGMYTAIEIMDLRHRVEALEETVSQPIELELILPGQFEVEPTPTPAPRKGRDC